ncbi:30S ribosomal protein S19e [Halodesulfurarchaeum formicicum]|uniref:30S ribosomal protein S19e n=1 Tax=Halodesulfurarchaeum formicicum TaxID=1873524 RepID=A0A1D8S1Y8_9EURY|nr:30S ribosomal protein S19e [Halodesulfurarchaeum formicicum]AOW79366.1 30S ribosomal protein S19e [Halodesulfurarchaeum formicicum]APE94628.1 30S ribosomal protein S19e [Halodesulfurarchaeum formicicum]
MATLYDAPADELIDALAGELADRIEAPDWADYTKTGANRELPPEQEDFWARRAASLLRKVAMNAPIGVESLSTAYGGTKGGSNRYAVAPSKRSDGSQKVIREILQDLEDEGLLMTREGEGRDITAEGQQLLDETAGAVIESLDDPALERYA